MVRFFLVCLLIGLLFYYPNSLFAQTDGLTFKKKQLSYPHVLAAWKKYNDTIGKQFSYHNLKYPPTDIYLRVFKSQNELELWARNEDTKEYQLVKTFHICALSGVLGPKRMKGDLQVPEGFYYIEDFNPQSNYYLSLLISYPNFADKNTSIRLGNWIDANNDMGGAIYLHGGCVTVGCLPMTDEGIKQLYVVCLNAKINGQDNIPIHIFPTRFTKSGISFLKREYAGDLMKFQFWNDLKESYDYFEKNHKLLPVMYTPEGRYVN